MEITLEMVERLKEKADVSHGQAKQALEYSGGNLLDALIYLEETGAIPRIESAYYSTKRETPTPSEEPLSLPAREETGTDDRPPPPPEAGRLPALFPGSAPLAHRQ